MRKPVTFSTSTTSQMAPACVKGVIVKNCLTVKCGPGKACRMAQGFPMCVCKPRCSSDMRSRGFLCGTDGRKYRNVCALERYNCANERQISVDYFGKCRKSCKKVNCENGKHCLQDQNGMPHCVYCDVTCDRTNQLIADDPLQYMCGENGRTYRNTCELKADICREGRSIRIAHFGSCIANETCNSLKCPQGTKCLMTASGLRPVCMNCDMACIQSINVPVCGSNRQTYLSYCHMLNAGCRSGVYISTNHGGACRSKKKRRRRISSKDNRTIKRIGADKSDLLQIKHKKTLRTKHKHSCRHKQCRKNLRQRRKSKLWKAYKSANLIALGESGKQKSKHHVRLKVNGDVGGNNT